MIYTNKYYNCGKKIVDYLLGNLIEGGTIYDEFDKKNTPDGDYAHTFLALSNLIIYNVEQDTNRLRDIEKILNYYFNIPSHNKALTKIIDVLNYTKVFNISLKGHEEFNNLALLLLYSKLKENNIRLDDRVMRELEKYLKNMKFSSKFGSDIPNNWFVIKALCLALEYNLFNKEKSKIKANDLIHNYILRWQLDDGFFYDCPDKINAKNYAVALAYHAKVCCMLIMYYQCTKDEVVLKAAERGLDALGDFIAPDGEALYFGRSNNSLFGYATAIYAYEKASEILEKKKKLYKSCASRLFSHILRRQSERGYITIEPNESKFGWESYLHHTVYNSYGASFLLLLKDVKESLISDTIEDNVSYAKDAGLVSISYPNMFMTLSTKGQFVLNRSVWFSDLRYSGMNIFAWKYRGKDLMIMPPYFGDRFKDTDARYGGFIPYIVKGEEIYSPKRYKDIDVVVKDYISIFGTGNFSYYHIPSIFKRMPYVFYRIYNSLFYKTFKERFVKSSLKELRNKYVNRLFLVLPNENVILIGDYLSSANEVDFSYLSLRLKTDMIKVDKEIMDGICLKNLYPGFGIWDVDIRRIETSKGQGYVIDKKTKVKEGFVSFNLIYPKGVEVKATVEQEGDKYIARINNSLFKINMKERVIDKI